MSLYPPHRLLLHSILEEFNTTQKACIRITSSPKGTTRDDNTKLSKNVAYTINLTKMQWSKAINHPSQRLNLCPHRKKFCPSWNIATTCHRGFTWQQITHRLVASLNSGFKFNMTSKSCHYNFVVTKSNREKITWNSPQPFPTPSPWPQMQSPITHHKESLLSTHRKKIVPPALLLEIHVLYSTHRLLLRSMHFNSTSLKKKACHNNFFLTQMDQERWRHKILQQHSLHHHPGRNAMWSKSHHPSQKINLLLHTDKIVTSKHCLLKSSAATTWNWATSHQCTSPTDCSILQLNICSSNRILLLVLLCP